MSEQKDRELIEWMRGSPTATVDLFRMLTGEVIGRGAFRTVYECDLNKDWVVKVETHSGEFSNTTEWQVWEWCNRCQPHIAEKYLAPCRFISPCGLFLIQDKTTKTDLKSYPKKVPAFLNNDIKESNWGLYKNRVVCHDYGMLRYTAGSKLEKVCWHD